MEFKTNGPNAVVKVSLVEGNKYLGYPSTYAKCMGNPQHLTDTSTLSEAKSAAACAAYMEKMKEKDLDHLEGNREMGYPGTVVKPAPSTASEDCPCAKERVASALPAEASLPKEKKQAANLVPYQRKDVFVQYTPEEQAQIKKNLKESDVKKKWWIEPNGESRAKDYSNYLTAKKSKKQWEKIDKKELKRDTKKEKKEHEKDAVKDDKSKINKLKKGKPSEKKSAEEHDLKKDEKFDTKGGLPPWLKKKGDDDSDDKDSDKKNPKKKNDDKKNDDKKGGDKKESSKKSEKKDKKSK
jgi:hypothetical protein